MDFRIQKEYSVCWGSTSMSKSYRTPDVTDSSKFIKLSASGCRLLTKRVLHV